MFNSAVGKSESRFDQNQVGCQQIHCPFRSVWLIKKSRTVISKLVIMFPRSKWYFQVTTYHVSNITVTALTPYLGNQSDSLSRHLWKLWFHSMHLFVILDQNQIIWFIWMFFISGKIWEFIFVNIRSGFSLSFFRMSEADPGLFPLSDWTQRHKLIHSSKMMKNASKHRKRHGRIYYSYWYV